MSRRVRRNSYSYVPSNPGTVAVQPAELQLYGLLAGAPVASRREAFHWHMDSSSARRRGTRVLRDYHATRTKPRAALAAHVHATADSGGRAAAAQYQQSRVCQGPGGPHERVQFGGAAAQRLQPRKARHTAHDGGKRQRMPARMLQDTRLRRLHLCPTRRLAQQELRPRHGLLLPEGPRHR